MIISASRRTDIPSFYMEWFMARLKEGVFHVRNPMNPRQVSRLSFTPEMVDTIVFWSKDPAPLLRHLHALSAYPYYVQFTLNGYDTDVEPILGGRVDTLLETFRRLSDALGSHRVVWRFDPILLSLHYTQEATLARFAAIAKALKGYGEKCVFSFLDIYRKNAKPMKSLGACRPGEEQARSLVRAMSEIAATCGFTLETCAEAASFREFGVEKGQCIDRRVIERITGGQVKAPRDKNQRGACGCLPSIDVGAYNTCAHGCTYCYANHQQEAARKAVSAHSPTFALMNGPLEAHDQVTQRDVQSVLYMPG